MDRIVDLEYTWSCGKRDLDYFFAKVIYTFGFGI